MSFVLGRDVSGGGWGWSSFGCGEFDDYRGISWLLRLILSDGFMVGCCISGKRELVRVCRGQ